MVLRVREFLAKRGFVKDDEGSIIVFIMVVFSAMFLVGGTAVDLARHENLRATMQYNLDRAVLAAASLKQSEDPEVIVQDYMSRVVAIDTFTVNVQKDVNINSRWVSATANAELDTWFLSMAGINNMPIRAHSEAEERIPNLEISLVLDVSGSMSGSKLTNLKVAAKEFVTTMLGNVDPDTVSISVVPFNHNVAPSVNLFDALSKDEKHDYSTCLDFQDSAFGSTAINPAVSQTHAVYTSLTGSWDALNDSRKTCYTEDEFEILPHQQSVSKLHTKIDGLSADGWTAAHMGLKWGLALLDPAFQPVVTSLTNVEATDPDKIDAGFDGIPVAWTDPDTMKVVVLMGDGANTYEFRMGSEYRGANSDVYEVNYTVQTFQYAYHKKKPWKTSTSESKCSKKKWICIYESEDYTDYYLKDGSQYLDIEDSNWITQTAFNNLPATLPGWTSTDQLDWEEAWGRMPADWYDNHTGEDAYDDLVWGTGRTSGEADTVMNSACNIARTNGIVVYTIGYETNATTSEKLRNCATTTAHYHDAAGTQISTVFAAIAASIQKLKLTQ
ncbi:MAG: VWA domain-containing protein [Pseudomonadota bacterium]